MQMFSMKRTGVSEEFTGDRIEWMLMTKLAELKQLDLGKDGLGKEHTYFLKDNNKDNL